MLGGRKSPNQKSAAVDASNGQAARDMHYVMQKRVVQRDKGLSTSVNLTESFYVVVYFVIPFSHSTILHFSALKHLGKYIENLLIMSYFSCHAA